MYLEGSRRGPGRGWPGWKVDITSPIKAVKGGDGLCLVGEGTTSCSRGSSVRESQASSDGLNHQAHLFWAPASSVSMSAAQGSLFSEGCIFGNGLGFVFALPPFSFLFLAVFPGLHLRLELISVRMWLSCTLVSLSSFSGQFSRLHGRNPKVPSLERLLSIWGGEVVLSYGM